MIKEFLWGAIKKHCGHTSMFLISNIFLVSILTLPFCPKRSLIKASVCAFFGVIALLIKWRSLSVLVSDAINNLRCKIFDQLLRQKLSYFDKNLPSELAPQLTYDLNNLGDAVSQTISHGTFYGVLLCASVGALVIQTQQFLFAALLLTPGLFVIKTKINNRPMIELTNYLYEVFGQLRTIFALNHQNIDQLMFKRWSQQVSQNKHKQDFRSNCLYITHLLITGVIVASIVLLSMRFMPVSLQQASTHKISGIMYALIGVLISLTMINTLQKSVEQYRGILQNVLCHINQAEEAPKAYRKLKTYPAQGLLAIHNVSFAYPNLPDHNVIQGFNFSIGPGETIAILGASGSGKSTLLNLMMGFYTPNAGKIYLDGIGLQDLDPEDLRDQVAMVDQDPQFFTASIYENILYGNPLATDQQLHDLIDHVVPPHWFDSFPKGLQTIIGPRGHGISVGQKQMIALLRILIRNPSVLLLDEATSGLDYDTENHVMRVLRPVIKNKTTIMVTHKLAQLDLADRLVVMHKGKIVGFGDHQKLFNENMFYRKLIMSEVDNTPVRAYE